MAVTSQPPKSEPFRCDVVPARRAVHVKPLGELDLDTAPVVARELQQLRDAGFDDLVLDLQGVTFADSTALRMMLVWTELSRADGFAFRLVRGPACVQRLFDLTATEPYFEFAE
jgi:anti-anti-sigma factor